MLLAVVTLVSLAACRADPGPGELPVSLIIVVLDTTRADAISAYGGVEGTTPAIDALAATGLLYNHAYANSSWTIPAHATLFTGLLPGQHGVGIRQWSAPGGLITLAQRLRDAGYQTAAFSENPLLALSGLDRGFDVFHDEDRESSRVVNHFRRWLETRDRQKPFFAFVNLMDAHVPYLVREMNPFIPPGETILRARKVQGRTQVQPMCRDSVSPQDLRLLKGLYLGGVAAADAKTKIILDATREALGRRPLITVVTSDHGENFGEHRLLGHLFGVNLALTHVPLVVAGLPSGQPARLDTPVQLADLLPSILSWTGLDTPPGLAGRVLPTSDERAGSRRTIFAEYADISTLPVHGDQPALRALQHAAEVQTRGCVAEDDVFGDKRAAIAYPYELLWSSSRPPRLFDIAADPQELTDVSATHAALAARLVNELMALDRGTELPSPNQTTPAATLAPEIRERLRSLGYDAAP